MINKEKIQEALEFYQDEIYDNDELDNSYISDEAIENDIKETAKEKLVDNNFNLPVDKAPDFELVDVELNDYALVQQEKEIVNYIINI